MPKRQSVSNALIKHEIFDEDGDLICKFAFNPTDVRLLGQYQTIMDEIKALPDQFGNKTPTLEEYVAFNNAIEEKINRLFGTNLFTVFSATTIDEDGVMFWEKIADIIKQDFAPVIGKRAEKMNQHIEKYTGNYQNGNRQQRRRNKRRK